MNNQARNNKLKGLTIFGLFILHIGLCPSKIIADGWFTQIYGGYGCTEKHNAYVNLPDAQIQATHLGLRFDRAKLIGIRETYNFTNYLGLGLDIAHIYGPNQKPQVSMTKLCVDGQGCNYSPEFINKFQNNLTSITAFFSLTYPLKINDRQIEPYAGCGAMLCNAKLKDTHNFIPPNQLSKSSLWGIKAFGGINIVFINNYGLFMEYQYNNYPVKTIYFNEKIVQGRQLGTTIGKQTFTIHTFVIGISYRIKTFN